MPPNPSVNAEIEVKAAAMVGVLSLRRARGAMMTTKGLTTTKDSFAT
jgi:hypothetical protein